MAIFKVDDYFRFSAPTENLGRWKYDPIKAESRSQKLYIIRGAWHLDYQGINNGDWFEIEDTVDPNIILTHRNNDWPMFYCSQYFFNRLVAQNIFVPPTPAERLGYEFGLL